MAFLMLLHEKLRLQRTKNKLYARQIKAGHRKDKVAKQIERIQKMYSKQISSLESTSKQAMSSFKANLTGSLGYGLSGMSGLGGLTGLAGGLFGALGSGIGSLFGDSSSDILTAMQTKFSDAKYADALSALASGDYTTLTGSKEGLEVSRYYNTLMSQQQAQVTQMCNMYEQNASIWLEAEKAALEEAQDAEIAPLEEQETDWELEEETTQTQLESIKARLENIESALRDEVKSSAPSFGLG